MTAKVKAPVLLPTRIRTAVRTKFKLSPRIFYKTGKGSEAHCEIRKKYVQNVSLFGKLNQFIKIIGLQPYFNLFPKNFEDIAF